MTKEDKLEGKHQDVAGEEDRGGQGICRDRPERPRASGCGGRAVDDNSTSSHGSRNQATPRDLKTEEKQLKQIPIFATREEEAKFWETNDSSEFELGPEVKVVNATDVPRLPDEPTTLRGYIEWALKLSNEERCGSCLAMVSTLRKALNSSLPSGSLRDAVFAAFEYGGKISKMIGTEGIYIPPSMAARIRDALAETAPEPKWPGEVDLTAEEKVRVLEQVLRGANSLRAEAEANVEELKRKLSVMCDAHSDLTNKLTLAEKALTWAKEHLEANLGPTEEVDEALKRLDAT